jgi:thymidine phosphorylase
VEARIGDRIERGSTLVTLHFNDEGRVEEAAISIARAYTIGSERVDPPTLIKAVLR